MRISDWSSDVCSSDLGRDDHDPGSASAGAVGIGDRAGERVRPQDRAPLYRARAGAAALWPAQAAAAAPGPVHGVSARAGDGVARPDRLAVAARASGTRLRRRLFGGNGLSAGGPAVRSEEHTSELQ